MRGNPLGILKPCEVKLLKLYKQHEIMSSKIINLLNLELASLNKEYAPGNNNALDNNGSNIEQYSLIEKGFVSRLSELNRVIKSYELADTVNSSELDRHRVMAFTRQKEIRDLSRANRKLLRFSLDKMASLLDLFNRKSSYVPASAGQLSPQFIDVSI